MTEIPDAVADAALRAYFNVTDSDWTERERNNMRRVIAAADKARGLDQRATLPMVPSEAAVAMAIKSWHQENWPSAYLTDDDVINNLIKCIKQALTAAYAIDGKQTAPQVSPIAHGVEDDGAVATAPSSANMDHLVDDDD